MSRPKPNAPNITAWVQPLARVERAQLLRRLGKLGHPRARGLRQETGLVIVGSTASADLTVPPAARRFVSGTVGARLRAAREAATATATELHDRAHTRGRKPPRGISLAELGARYDRLRSVAVGVTLRHHIGRWESGRRVPSPEARHLLEQALSLPKGALVGPGEHCGRPRTRCWSDRRSCECACEPCVNALRLR